MHVLRIIGFFSLLMGLVLFLNTNFTGYVIANEINDLPSSVGLIFIIIGAMLISMARKPDLENIEGVRITDQFKKASKGYDLKRIQAAIAKIDAGLGRQEQLTHIGRHGLYSIRVGKGDRILYRRQGGEVVLENYIPYHY